MVYVDTCHWSEDVWRMNSNVGTMESQYIVKPCKTNVNPCKTTSSKNLLYGDSWLCPVRLEVPEPANEFGDDAHDAQVQYDAKLG